MSLRYTCMYTLCFTMAKIILCEILKFANFTTLLRSTLRDHFLGVELPSLSVIPKDFLISDRDLCRTVSHASMTCVVVLSFKLLAFFVQSASFSDQTQQFFSQLLIFFFDSLCLTDHRMPCLLQNTDSNLIVYI